MRKKNLNSANHIFMIMTMHTDCQYLFDQVGINIVPYYIGVNFHFYNDVQEYFDEIDNQKVTDVTPFCDVTIYNSSLRLSEKSAYAKTVISVNLSDLNFVNDFCIELFHQLDDLEKFTDGFLLKKITPAIKYKSQQLELMYLNYMDEIVDYPSIYSEWHSEKSKLHKSVLLQKFFQNNVRNS